MENNKRYIKRSFFIHEYEKEEVFLSEMARQGWHFANLYRGIPTKYEFVKGEKINYIYQLDFVTNEEDTEDYHQLFADAGWDEVFSWKGIGGKWYYFRRVHSDGQNERIFTDSESKYQMYNKLWKKYAIFLVMGLIIELNAVISSISGIDHSGLVSVFGITMVVLACCFALFSALIVYWMIAILMERNKIKRRLNGRL